MAGAAIGEIMQLWERRLATLQPLKFEEEGEHVAERPGGSGRQHFRGFTELIYTSSEGTTGSRGSTARSQGFSGELCAEALAIRGAKEDGIYVTELREAVGKCKG
eukprot:Skav235586  [mRNA]  locus=scaffold163:41937:43540:+ [translate_table: standard]